MNDLVKEAQNGDAEAFISLMEECKMMLRRVAFSYLGNDEDVADAIQDTILSAYENINGLKKVEYFKTWLIRILINHCTKIWRSNKRLVSFTEEYDSGTYRSDICYSESGSFDKADLEFKELLYSLPEDSRTIFQLYYGERFTTREISDILDMKENTVKSRLRRGKEQLRMELQQG